MIQQEISSTEFRVKEGNLFGAGFFFCLAALVAAMALRPTLTTSGYTFPHLEAMLLALGLLTVGWFSSETTWFLFSKSEQIFQFGSKRPFRPAHKFGECSLTEVVRIDIIVDTSDIDDSEGEPLIVVQTENNVYPIEGDQILANDIGDFIFPQTPRILPRTRPGLEDFPVSYDNGSLPRTVI